MKDRGYLKLGLPGNNPGFAVETENEEFAGFDVDLGKAIAAALFEDPSKLEITEQLFPSAFNNTGNGVVDVSAMGITHNLLRDATLGIDFSPSYLYTGQIETEFAIVTNNAATSEALIVYNSNDGKLFYNENGSEPGFGKGGEFAVLAGQPAISGDDFLIR
ncbi:MAG: transporter substrate-binding domain-containing protein [Okeania sp. SIO2F4]|uniref:transporter substrate-binding domain-containing protein n=1 Tax=Okeania sp. SIO2F4 TaxID=2607790 RepID=UPI00142CCF0E|nr:transporter substrate-binding domain-containing protein [Okeania sp. SIO2F4]NES02867.1 transporter substrate-binding domain-containing protein [Okeania sp. SIO2F4]